MDQLPSVDSDDTIRRIKKTVKELRKIREKLDENSLWLSDFGKTKGRKVRKKLKETTYKDTHVGIVGAVVIYQVQGASLANVGTNAGNVYSTLHCLFTISSQCCLINDKNILVTSKK